MSVTTVRHSVQRIQILYERARLNVTGMPFVNISFATAIHLCNVHGHEYLLMDYYLL